MSARSVAGSIFLFPLCLAACSTRSPEREPETAEATAPPRDQASATPGASAPAATEPATDQPVPPVDITWKLVPTRTEGALEIIDASGGRSEVFSASLPLGCARSPEPRGVLLAAQCTGTSGTVQLTVRRARKELTIEGSGMGSVTGLATLGKQGATDTGSAPGAQGAQILARIPLTPDMRTIRPRASATDAAKTGELLLDWSFAPYHDVHVVIERTGAAKARPEASPEATVDEFITELPGCEQPAPARALAQGQVAEMVCRHRGRTATLTARPQPGAVLAEHTVSGEGLEQHQVDAREIPLPAKPPAGTP